MDTHTDPQRINAPPVQYALINNDFALQCSSDFTESVTYQWLRGGQDTSINGVLPSVQISDEGDYVCRTYLPAQDINFEKTVELRVVGKFSRMYIHACVHTNMIRV